jgi:hypothetical protein
LAVLTAVVA